MRIKVETVYLKAVCSVMQDVYTTVVLIYPKEICERDTQDPAE